VIPDVERRLGNLGRVVLPPVRVPLQTHQNTPSQALQGPVVLEKVREVLLRP
jgi:hypothetical protein